jgi:hypothetical protein
MSSAHRSLVRTILRKMKVQHLMDDYLNRSWAPHREGSVRAWWKKKSIWSDPQRRGPVHDQDMRLHVLRWHGGLDEDTSRRWCGPGQSCRPWARMTVPRRPNNGVTGQECLLIVSAEVDINNDKEWSGGGATTEEGESVEAHRYKSGA